MYSGIKPLIQRLQHELEGTTADPEAVLDIFFEWAAQMTAAHVYDQAGVVQALRKEAKDLN